MSIGLNKKVAHNLIVVHIIHSMIMSFNLQMFTHGAKRGNLSKITNCRTSIVHECLLLLAFESGETGSNRQSYVLLAICNIQIISFLVVCLFALTIS